MGAELKSDRPVHQTPATRAADLTRQAGYLAHVLAGTEYAAQADDLAQAVKEYAANALAREDMATQLERIVHAFVKDVERVEKIMEGWRNGEKIGA